MFEYKSLIESLLLVLAISLDTFVASIGYGTNKIKIPLFSAIIINIVCTSSLALSLYCGSLIKKILPGKVAVTIGSITLIFLGIYYLFEGIIKTYFTKNPFYDKKVKFRLFFLKIIIDIYVDETKADFNNSKDISPKEAIYLASVLSLDSLVTGLGTSFGEVSFIQAVSLSLFLGILALWIGLNIGRKIVQKSKLSLSWLSGVLLLILGIIKLI
jgi:putative sporulation protein YtaF